KQTKPAIYATLLCYISTDEDQSQKVKILTFKMNFFLGVSVTESEYRREPSNSIWSKCPKT
ncbi:hypothetical protein L9F63_018719, partial [Diploptera punctata]